MKDVQRNYNTKHYKRDNKGINPSGLRSKDAESPGNLPETAGKGSEYFIAFDGRLRSRRRSCTNKR